MGQVTVTMNGRSYRLHCGDGEEKRVQELASYVASKVESLIAEFGTSGHERLMMMAALLITDELFEALGGAANEPDSSSVSSPATAKADRNDGTKGSERAAKTVIQSEPKSTAPNQGAAHGAHRRSGAA